ncbi:MAG: hypothetical protein AAGK17_04190 [Pseudomonadota bacterium]
MTAKRLGFATAAAVALTIMSTPAPASAQMRAILPTVDQVEPLDRLDIDGEWEIREINERIVIDRGRAFAVDGWVHMMLFQIEPEQVVIRNIRELADGDFIADDLPLMSSVKLDLIDEDTLRARTQSLVPVTYHLVRVSGGRDGWRDDDDFYDDDDSGTRPPADDEDDDDYVSPW